MTTPTPRWTADQAVQEHPRFAGRFVVSPSGCWEWAAGLRISLNGRWGGIHRLAASIALGLDLDSDAVVLRSCQNRRCIRPSHMTIDDRPDALTRFATKYVIDPETGCWLWTAATSSGGYGTFGMSHSETMSAHRASYILHMGPLSSDLEVDHRCRVRACVNPDHLEPVTPSENVRRAKAAKPERTHCAHGHLLDEANSYVRRVEPRKVSCRACGREYARQRYGYLPRKATSDA